MLQMQTDEECLDLIQVQETLFQIICAKYYWGLEYDKDGVIAASGKVDASLMDHFMKHPFWDRPVPRSGWSQDYSEEYIKATIQKFSFLPKEDLLLPHVHLQVKQLQEA